MLHTPFYYHTQTNVYLLGECISQKSNCAKISISYIITCKSTLIDWIRRFLGKRKFPKHILIEPISLGISYISNNLFFRETQRIDRLSPRPVNNCTPGKCRGKSSSVSPLGRLIYICSIHKTHQLSLMNFLIGFGNIFVPCNWMSFGFWKIRYGSNSFVSNPPVSGNTGYIYRDSSVNFSDNHNEWKRIYIAWWTWSIPRRTLRYHSLVGSENRLFIVGIGPIRDKEL